MYLYKRSSLWKNLYLAIAIFFAALCVFWYGFSHISQANDTQNLKTMRAAIQKSIVSCYAIEGVYPPDVRYLEEHYGIVINHSRYIIRYDSAGANIMPSVEVLEKGAD